MHLSTLFKISLAALAVLGVSAQDEGAGYVTKCVTPGQVALTFDDGPSPYTPKLLEYLATAKIPATFFVLGVSINSPGGKEALKAAFDAGHQIALHSNTHADMNTLTPAKIKDEYTINLKAVVDTIGRTPKMARPPYGNCNAACAKVLQGEMGLSIIQWNCDSNDWQYEGKVADQPKLFTNMANIINPSNPKTDSFVTLQHDIKDYSVAYVPKVIEMIQAKGYNFVTVEQCLGGKVPAYAEGPAGKAAPVGAPAAAPAAVPPAAAPAPVPAPAPAPAPVAAPAPAPAANAGTPAFPPPPPASAANAEDSKPSTISSSSAVKVASAFSLNLLCLVFGLLMY